MPFSSHLKDWLNANDVNFTISYKKDFNFIGREALEKIKDKKIDRKFAMFVLKYNEPGKPLLLHDEPIYKDDRIGIRNLGY